MLTKMCSKCSTVKSASEFYETQKHGKDTLSSYCRVCSDLLRNTRKYMQKKAMVQYKGGCCVKCGYNKCLNALDFHHVNSEEKDFTIAQKFGFSLKTGLTNEIKLELDKCILVCSNCHREIHSFKYGDIEHKQKKTTLCECGTQINYGTKFCKSCLKTFIDSRRKVQNRPSKDELNELLKTNSVVSVGKMFGVSDNAIRKWLR